MFSLFILIGALWGLSFEMVEDSFVNLLYARLFGAGPFLSAFVVATVLVVPASTAFVLVAPTLLLSYLPLVAKGGALLLVVIGVGWLAFAAAGKGDEIEEAREAVASARSARRSFAVATQLVAIEETEIVVILVPLVFDAHAAEAVVAGVIGAAAALGTALALRHRFATIAKRRLGLLKIASGSGLILLGSLLFLT